jgi:hypothetical protein
MIGLMVDEMGRIKIDVPSRNLPGGNEENYEKPQSK